MCVDAEATVAADDCESEAASESSERLDEPGLDHAGVDGVADLIRYFGVEAHEEEGAVLEGADWVDSGSDSGDIASDAPGPPARPLVPRLENFKVLDYDAAETELGRIRPMHEGTTKACMSIYCRLHKCSKLIRMHRCPPTSAILDWFEAGKVLGWGSDHKAAHLRLFPHLDAASCADGGD